MNKTELVYLLQKLHMQNAPVRTKPLGATGKYGTNMYSPRPGWLRDSSWKLYSDAFILDEQLVGYIKYANVTSRKPNFIEKINADFLKEMQRRGGKIERI